MYFLQGKFRDVKRYCNKHMSQGYFEFEPGYTSTDYKFREIDRFLWESKHSCTRYKNSYNGPIVINLTQWNGKRPNIYFHAFMYFLADRITAPEDCIFFTESIADRELVDAVSEHFKLKLKTIGIKKAKEEEKSHTIGFI